MAVSSGRKPLSVHFALSMTGEAQVVGEEEPTEFDEEEVDSPLADAAPDDGHPFYLTRGKRSVKLPLGTKQVLAATTAREQKFLAKNNENNEIKIALEQILPPISEAIQFMEAVIRVAERDSMNCVKESNELLLVLKQINSNIAAESGRMRSTFIAYKFRMLTVVDTTKIVDYQPYKNLLKQANDIKQLIMDITKDSHRDNQFKAITDYRKTISWSTFATEGLKRLCFMLIGAAIGFVTFGYATAPAEAATVANVCGVGALVGAGAGLLAGDLAYKQCLFGAMSNEYRLVYASQAFFDKTNPEKGCLAMVKRGLNKF